MAAGSIVIDLLMKTGAFETDAKKAEKRWNELTRSITKGAASIGAAFSVFKGVEMADGYTQMAARIRNATESTEEYNLVQQRLEKSAKTTFRALSEAQEGYLAFAPSMKALGYSTKQALDLTDSLSFSFTANAARADQAQSANDALAKSMARGKVDAKAWMSILMAADNVAGQIAKTMGITELEVRQLGSTGKLALDDLVQGLIAAKGENESLANAMENSIADGLTNLQTSITVFLGKMNMATGATGNAAGALGVLADNIDVVAKGVVLLSSLYAGRFVGAQALVIAGKYKEIAQSRQVILAVNAESVAKRNLVKVNIAAANASKLALGVLGGWIGLATTLASVAAGFFLVSKGADDATDALTDQKKSVQELAQEYKELANAQKTIKISELETELKSLRVELASFGMYDFMGGGQQNKTLIDFRNNLISIDELLERLNDEGYNADKLKAIEKEAKAYKNIQDKIEENAALIDVLNGKEVDLSKFTSKATNEIKKQSDEMKSLKTNTEDTQKALERFTKSQDENSKSLAMHVELLRQGNSEREIEYKLKLFGAAGFDKNNLSEADVYKVEQQAKMDEANQKTINAFEEIEKAAKKATEARKKEREELAKLNYLSPYDGKYRITSGMGSRNTGIKGASRNHKGIDIAMPKGTPLKAMADGIVKEMGKKGGYGNTIVIKYNDGSESRYAHLNGFADIQKGQRVNGGQTVGFSGNTGISGGKNGGYHAHIEFKDPNGVLKDFREMFGVKSSKDTSAIHRADKE